MDVVVRDAHGGDAEAIADLVRLLAEGLDEVSPVTSGFVREYLGLQGHHALVAEDAGRTVGVLAYTVHLDLYHAAASVMIEALAVHPDCRDAGVGGALVDAALQRFRQLGCAEASVSVVLANERAQRFYRRHGFSGDALLLETHFDGE